MAGSAVLRRHKFRLGVAVLIRWGWFVLLCTVIGGGSAYAVSKRQHAVYRATTLLVVDQRSPTGDPYTSVLASNQLVQTYVKLIKTPPVLNRAASQVGGISGAQLNGVLRVSNPGVSTQIIEVQADDAHPERAAELANAVASSFVAVQRATLGTSNVRVFQTASPPTTRANRSPRLYAAIGGLAGLLLAVGLVWLLEVLDDRIRTAEDVQQATGLIPVGTLMRHRKERLLLTANGSPSLAESLRILRTNLDFAVDTPLSTIVVTSAMAGEGKTTVAINLALSLAQAGKRVLLIDADLRRPSVHKRLGLPNEDGLSLCLQEDHGLGSALPFVRLPGKPNFSVLTAGPLPPNPTELLGSPKMQHLLASLLATDERPGPVDVVVLDTPPAASCADPAILAANASATLLVVDVKHCRARQLVRAFGALSRVNARIAGFVLNQVTKGDEAYYYPYESNAARQQRAASPDLFMRVGAWPESNARQLAAGSPHVPNQRDENTNALA